MLGSYKFYTNSYDTDFKSNSIRTDTYFEHDCTFNGLDGTHNTTAPYVCYKNYNKITAKYIRKNIPVNPYYINIMNIF